MDIFAFNTSRSFGAGRAGPCQRFYHRGFQTVWNSLILDDFWKPRFGIHYGIMYIYNSFQSKKLTLDDLEVPQFSISIYFHVFPYISHTVVRQDLTLRVFTSTLRVLGVKHCHHLHTNTILFWMRQGHDDKIPYFVLIYFRVSLREKRSLGTKGYVNLVSSGEFLWKWGNPIPLEYHHILHSMAIWRDHSRWYTLWWTNIAMENHHV